MANETKADPSPNVLRLVDDSEKHIADMLKLGLSNIVDNMKIQFNYLKEERTAESDRIDNLRQVDTKAVEVALQAAKQEAEVLRMAVEKTATTIAEQLTQLTNSLILRIAALEKAQYETSGKSGLSDKLQMVIVGIICSLITGIIFLVFKL